MHEAIGRLPNGDSLVLGSAIVTGFPSELREEEIGGLLNPQLLAGGGKAAVLDLRAPEFRLEDFDDAVRRVVQ